MPTCKLTSLTYANLVKHKALNTLTCRELLYPCYYFDHATAFAEITKFLVYSAPGHIESTYRKESALTHT